MLNKFQPASRLDNMFFSPVRAVLEKANAMAASGREIIHMEIGEPDFDTPTAIVDETVRALVDRKLTHYGSNRGSILLRETIAAGIKSASGVDFDSQSEVLITVGAA